MKTRLTHEDGKTSEVSLIPAKLFGRWLVKDKPELADEMLEAGATQYLCKQRGILPVKVNDPRFGQVNSYPDTVLMEMTW